jgi:hypothetical protein
MMFTSQGCHKYIPMSVAQAETGKQEKRSLDLSIVQPTVFLATSTSQKKETV